MPSQCAMLLSGVHSIRYIDKCHVTARRINAGDVCSDTVARMCPRFVPVSAFLAGQLVFHSLHAGRNRVQFEILIRHLGVPW